MNSGFVSPSCFLISDDFLFLLSLHVSLISPQKGEKHSSLHPAMFNRRAVPLEDDPESGKVPINGEADSNSGPASSRHQSPVILVALFVCALILLWPSNPASPPHASPLQMVGAEGGAYEIHGRVEAPMDDFGGTGSPSHPDPAAEAAEAAQPGPSEAPFPETKPSTLDPPLRPSLAGPKAPGSPPLAPRSYGSKTATDGLSPVLPDVNPMYSGVTPQRTFSESSPPDSPLFDIPCPGKTDGNPVCACQVNCQATGQSAPCAKSISVCDSLSGCTQADVNPQQTWATLKRSASDEELALIQAPVTSWTMDDVDKAFGSGYNNPLKDPADPRVSDILSRAGIDSSSPLSTKSADLCHGGEPQYKPENPPTSYADIADNTLGVVALTLDTPATLLNSMLTWSKSGLLDVTSEKLLIANKGIPSEVALGLDYGFHVLEPSSIPNAKLNPSKSNVITIGSAFHAALDTLSTDYVLFLEKDFSADHTLDEKTFMREIATAIQLLEEGAWIIRLRSRSQQGCDSFKDCGKAAKWSATHEPDRRKNHWSFYCDNYAELPGASNMISQCVDDGIVEYRCHTSRDTNWSLNAVLVKREVMMEATPQIPGTRPFPEGSIANFGLSTFDDQMGFEGKMIEPYNWGQYKIPICISIRGAFFHAEVDG